MLSVGGLFAATLTCISTTYAATPVTISASEAQTGNPAVNSFDGSLTTRWSANGDGQWIQYDFGTSVTLSAIQVAFLNGNLRSATFQIESTDTPEDSGSWLQQNISQSSGDTIELEQFDLSEDVTAQYFRIVGYGNSSNTWNSITETAFIDGEQQWNPQTNWEDSYAVDGTCYCNSSNYDHNLDSKTALTPIGELNVVEICEDIKAVLGEGSTIGRIPYNDIQCGNGPANDAADEAGCPGRVDIGSAGCQDIGPTWDLESVYSTATCDLPLTSSDIEITQETKTVSSGAIDISCANSVNISMVIAGIGPMETADYLNVYYRVDGGAAQSIAAHTGAFNSNTIEVPTVSGNQLEIIVEGYTSYSDETYSIFDMQITENENIHSTEKLQLDDASWSLSSTTNSDNLENAIDGDDSTRWSTGTKQSAGQELVISFNESLYFDRIVLNSEKSENDYPRSISISISNDGSHWTQVTSASGADALSVIDFSDQSASFVKLQQTGSDSYYYWSIHELEIWANAAGTEYGDGDELPEGYTEISSMAELEQAFATSNGKFKMKPGYYTASKLLDDKVTILRTTGNNSIYDFTGATIDLPVTLLRTMSGAEHTHASWKMEGNNNTFIGGTFVNTYADGTTTITDWKAHNDNSNNRPGGNNVYLRIWGDNATFLNTTLVVRGSFPYGYGEIYGKGGSTVFGKNKHSGIQIVGNGATLDGVNLSQFAYGHGIFMQGADDTTIRNTQVLGEVRQGADMYNDGADSLPGRSGYIQYHPEWREGPIPTNKMFSLAEDGIRSYASGSKLDGSTGTTGSVSIVNSSVTHMRSGVALVAASEPAYVDNVELRGNEGGFNLPRSGGEIVNSRADAAYGIILDMPYGNEYNWNVDITVIEAIHQVGDHYLTHIGGSGHNIILRSDGNTPTIIRPIKVGYTWDRWDVTGDTGNHTAKNITLTNSTDHEVELTQYSSAISGESQGKVVDLGSGNSLK